MLEGDDPGGRALALILRNHPGEFRQLMCPHPGEFAQFFKKMLMPGGQPVWGLGLTDALLSACFVIAVCTVIYSIYFNVRAFYLLLVKDYRLVVESSFILTNF